MYVYFLYKLGTVELHITDSIASLLDPDYSILEKAIVIHEGHKNALLSYVIWHIWQTTPVPDVASGTRELKEMRPLYACVFYVRIQAAKTGLFWQFIG